MSDPTNDAEQECKMVQGCAAVDLIIEARQKDLGGFSVRRLLPTTRRKMVGPWIFFDHMGPAQFPAGEGVNVRPHPHINLATVTYLFAGEILHRDSLGNVQAIRPGDINLMVAGRGITHSERERPEVRNVPHSAHGLQLWLALPEEFEEVEPAFYHYPGAKIPAVTVNGVPVRVMMGSAFGVTSPVKTYARTLYLEASLHAGQTLALPDAEECAVYALEGSLRAGHSLIPEHAMAVLSRAGGIVIEAAEDARIAVIGGATLSRRYVDWNFVSSRKQRIEQARRDWQEGRFAKVPGDEEEFIPLPD
ncbi:pirin family protein [Pseudomaricurvus alcaniphilus]|uniref:pirin family protein n=1 Tax=Pseudomaricurvus alcaniphilus TaxID=1166482 RepID=UPI00140A54B0|nr:pirin family protein [Pseudomaricurvus alcaniphilus]NHN36945.1 pirin family protein [Pseudomaricurvus alcaniphilus]